MRPPLERIESQPRRQSITEHYAPPMTYFLTRDTDLSEPGNEPRPASSKTSPVRGLKETIDETSHRASSTRTQDDDVGAYNRRRSTIKASTHHQSRRESSVHSAALSARHDSPSTPLNLPSRDSSLPSSPKSGSSRSMQKSEDGTSSEETRSQAIASSDDEETPAAVQDSAPQLIMPSIKMPSRRPFTERGKRTDRFKILVAGCKGTGKTSLIKAIVQLCDDIVHVDPLTSNTNTPAQSSSQAKLLAQTPACTEIYASTKPYPSWWSDIDESKVLRRRKSMGESVLERNICFVEASQSSKTALVIQYLEQQIQRALASCQLADHDLVGLMSGRGGTQVDLVLYLISQDTLQKDIENIEQLSKLANVVPLVSKADLLSGDEISSLKKAIDAALTTLPRVPFPELDGDEHTQDAVAPYTVSSASGSDRETIDASLLMSPEYVQPLIPSELGLLVEQIFDAGVMKFLRHTAAKKLISWHLTRPDPGIVRYTIAGSPQHSTLTSPLQTSMTQSGMLVRMGSDLSLTTSNSYALARVADHAQREERLAQVRLSKWASDLQTSLQRERERYERVARNERAIWLLERMGEEVRDGQVLPLDSPQSLTKSGPAYPTFSGMTVPTHDPLGLLRWQDTIRTRGWIALQVISGFGVVGGLACWLAKTWGVTGSLHEWLNEWYYGINE